MSNLSGHPLAPGVRYGFYLRPSLAMSRAQADLHGLLARQYGLLAASRFPPHATLKGFFRSTAGTEELTARLRAMLAGRPAFPVFNDGVMAFGHEAIVLDIDRTEVGQRNAALRDLHEGALDALLPLVDQDGEFTWTDPGIRERFHAHLTLAFADIPAARFEEIIGFVRDAEPIGPRSFLADTLHLLAFTSDRWDGTWWETLRWRLVESWHLDAPV